MHRPSWRPGLLAAVFGLLAFVGSVVAATVFADLGVTEETARNTAYNWFCGGSFYLPGDAQVFKKAAPKARAEMVTAVLTFGKAYLQSDAFATRYAEYRKANRPTPLGEGEVAGEDAGTPLKQIEDSIKQMQESMKSMPPDMQKETQKAIEDMKAQLKQMQADPETRKALETGVLQQQQAVVREYEKTVREFDERYPADRNQMVARRLREFLDFTADLDFNAKLVTEGETKRFAEARYEERSREWKLCFRAGKPAVDAARAFAQAWLKQLQVTP